MSDKLEELANKLTTGDLSYKPTKMDWKNKLAHHFGSDFSEAVDPSFLGSAITRHAIDREKDSLANQGLTDHYVFDREYRGQNIDFRGDEEALNKVNQEHGIENAPDLLGVFVGEKSPNEVGLRYSINSPGNYPWGKDTKVYDASPYIKFLGFEGSPESEFILESKINDLKPGDSISWKDLQNLGININHHTSVDFGERINWSIGKTDEGNAYLAMADIWDFKNMGLKGNLMEKYGKGEGVSNIGFYGRFDINSDGDYENE